MNYVTGSNEMKLENNFRKYMEIKQNNSWHKDSIKILRKYFVLNGNENILKSVEGN